MEANNKVIGYLDKLTEDQLKAYNNIIEWANSPFDKNKCKRCLTGYAGTGKTYLVKVILQSCNIPYSKIGIASPTHKACRVLSESLGDNIKCSIKTIHSDLGFKVNFDLSNFDINNPPFDPKGQVKVKNFDLYLVDEASMLNRGLCSYLEKVCIANNVKLLYIGDAAQLAPVGELYSPAFKGIVTDSLTQIVRQDDDNPLKDLLTIIRKDIQNKTFEFIKYITSHRSNFTSDNSKGYMVCNNSEFTNLLFEYYKNEELLHNVDYVKVIAYTNQVVSGWNKVIRQTIIQDADSSVLTKNDLLIAYTTLVDDFNDIIIKNSEDYIVADKVNYVHPKYSINGFLIKLQAIHGGNITQPLFVVDHSNKGSLELYVRLTNTLIDNAKRASSALRASKWKEYFAFKEEVLLLTNIKQGTKIIKGRDIDYGFALTAHKSQGSTFDNCFVDLDDMLFDSRGNVYANADDIRRRVYVALSRAKYRVFIKYTR